MKSPALVKHKLPVDETRGTKKNKKSNVARHNISKEKEVQVQVNREKSADCNALIDPNNRSMATAKFVKDDNIVEFGATEDQDEFPSEGEIEDSQSEDESLAGSESEIEPEDKSESQNNNATVDPEPSTSGGFRPNLHESFEMMQDFLLHKGVLSTSMSQDDMQEFIEGVNASWAQRDDRETSWASKPSKDHKNLGNLKQSKKKDSGNSASSVTTIYKSVVPNIAANKELTLGKKHRNIVDPGRKVSSSSDKLIDTNDENLEISPNSNNAITRFIAELPISTDGSANKGESGGHKKLLTPEERAQEVIREAEQSKAHMYDVAGELSNLRNINLNQHSMLMDEDYQMIGSNLDDTLKRKIWNFEYVDLSRLLSKGQGTVNDNSQCLGIVNKDGVSYLTPVADRDIINVSSYRRWEQAFRIYSNVLTT